MVRIVVGSPNLTQPLLLYPGLGPAMLEQHRRSSSNTYLFKLNSNQSDQIEQQTISKKNDVGADNEKMISDGKVTS
jgi:hypothetical protein